MAYRVAINGYGRIGRNILRAYFESTTKHPFEIVAINDLGDLESNAHLTRYDSVHGRFPGTVETEAGHLVVNGHKIQVLAERNPELLPWQSLKIDLVLECTGFFTNHEKAALHLKAGAKKVLISAPAGSDVKTVVYGVNHTSLTAQDTVVSNASCTTNCLAPLAKVLHESVGIESGLMVTVHSYTSDQRLTDMYHSDLRRARAAALSMIPTKTGAAAAVGMVLPELNGKLDGYAMRVPTANVSVIDLTFVPLRETTVKEVNDVVRSAASGALKGILGYNEEPLVSIDFNHNPHSSTFDAHETRQLGRLIKVISWYDNEWGFSNRMLDTAGVMLRV